MLRTHEGYGEHDEVVGVRPHDVLLLKAAFELREALATWYDEEELVELESQDA